MSVGIYLYTFRKAFNDTSFKKIKFYRTFQGASFEKNQDNIVCLYRNIHKTNDAAIILGHLVLSVK